MFVSLGAIYAASYTRQKNAHPQNQLPLFRGSAREEGDKQCVTEGEETFMRETAAIAEKIRENEAAIDQLRVENAESKQAKGIHRLKALLKSIQRSVYTKNEQKEQIKADIAKFRTPSIDERTAKKRALRAENAELDAQLQGYIDRFESSGDAPQEET